MPPSVKKQAQFSLMTKKNTSNRTLKREAPYSDTAVRDDHSSMSHAAIRFFLAQFDQVFWPSSVFRKTTWVWLWQVRHTEKKNVDNNSTVFDRKSRDRIQFGTQLPWKCTPRQLIVGTHTLVISDAFFRSPGRVLSEYPSLYCFRQCGTQL